MAPTTDTASTVQQQQRQSRHASNASTAETKPTVSDIATPPATPTIPVLRLADPVHDPSTVISTPPASSTVPPITWEDTLEWVIPIVLTIISAWTRFRDLIRPAYVVWDEAHFGKFGSYYLKNEFYHDVHPPLGKMMVAFAGLLAGYDGSFEFKSGAAYPDSVNYPAMRLFIATFGMLVVPLGYLTALNLGLGKRAATLVGIMLLLDNGTLTITRYILLDPTLLFFVALSFFFFTAFHVERDEPFGPDWWFWLLLTGIAIGMVSSVKWIGLFTVALVGFHTIEDLYTKLPLVKSSWKTYAIHWIARIVCLILIPILMYMASFVLHFSILSGSGAGDAQMSSLFKAGLRGSNLLENPLELAYGSLVTIKNYGYGNGLLHSHIQHFPEGSQQQQVTAYHHKDNNNNWIVHRAYEDQAKHPLAPTEDPDVQFVKHGDVIRLVHEQTGRNLHTHEVEAPISKQHWEVSGYGNLTQGDVGDLWRVEIVDDRLGYVGEKVRSLSTRFLLRSVRLGCLLRSGDETLPEWGFKQAEVICDRDGNEKDLNNMWNVEYHRHPKLLPAPSSSYRTNFLDDLLQVNIAMWKTNNALIPDEDKNDIMTSHPLEWPFLTRGMRMTGWNEDGGRVYMLGNPIVWWTSSASIAAYLILVTVYAIRRRRGYVDFSPVGWEFFTRYGKFVVGGWALNYLPFFLMGRVTYLHHYFPALYYSVFMPPFLLEHAMAKLKIPNTTRWMIMGAVIAIIAGVFTFFWDISYGIRGPDREYCSRKWLKSWNICGPEQPPVEL